MSHVKRYELGFTADDVVDYRFVIDRGSMVGFDINYRIRAGGEWLVVYRIDTRHGAPHIHRFWRPVDEQIENLPPNKEMWQLYRLAQLDLKENWARYRQLFEGSL